jgi:hypothetical protein
VKLAVTIDAEADGQWTPGVPITTRNVAFWPPFQDLCERHGVAPTYLIASEIVGDEKARESLRGWVRRGAAEVGAHLHPWTTPPFHDRPGLRYNDLQHAFPCQLPDELLREKTTNLTLQIEQAFCRRPTSYRAGRFGIDGRLAQILTDQGYVTDSSVTPLCSWRDHPGLGGHGGPDFRAHGLSPFVIDGTGPGGLLELPVTVCVTYACLRRWPLLLQAYGSRLGRAVRKHVLSPWLAPQPVWLSPDPRYDTRDLTAAWHRGRESDPPSAVMMFHSSELMPGGSPFRPDAQSVRDLLAQLDTFFRHVREHGGSFATLSGLAAEVLAVGKPEVRSL